MPVATAAACNEPNPPWFWLCSLLWATADNAWIRSVRAEIAAARKAHEEKLQELPDSADLAGPGVD